MRRSDAIAVAAAPIYAELVAWRRASGFVVDDDSCRLDREEATQQAHALVLLAERRFADLNGDAND